MFARIFKTQRKLDFKGVNIAECIKTRRPLDCTGGTEITTWHCAAIEEILAAHNGERDVYAVLDHNRNRNHHVIYVILSTHTFIIQIGAIGYVFRIVIVGFIGISLRIFPAQRSLHLFERYRIHRQICQHRRKIAQLIDRCTTGGLENGALLQVSMAILVIGCCADDFHMEFLRQLDVIALRD